MERVPSGFDGRPQMHIHLFTVQGGDEELRLREAGMVLHSSLRGGGWGVARVLDFYKNPMIVLKYALK